MRRHLLRVSTALLVALCSACATLQPAPVDRAGVNAKWRTHHDTLASIQHFTLNGRAASGVDVKADLRWQQFDDGHFEIRSEEHTSELQSLMSISYSVFC